MSTTISNKARVLHSRLFSCDQTVPHNREFLLLLTALCRDAATSARQAEDECNYEWAQEPDYQKRVQQCDARLEAHGKELARLWPGASLKLAGDPRGYVVTIFPPGEVDRGWVSNCVGVA
jgi:hypothetical protein